MYITEHDILSLITVAGELKSVSMLTTNHDYSRRLSHLSDHVRKVYLLLLANYRLCGKIPVNELLKDNPLSDEIQRQVDLLCPTVT